MIQGIATTHPKKVRIASTGQRTQPAQKSHISKRKQAWMQVIHNGKVLHM